MELGRFKPGDTLLLHDGSRAEVLSPSEDGRRIRARYLDSPGEPSLAGTEGLIAEEEVSGFSPAKIAHFHSHQLHLVVGHPPGGATWAFFCPIRGNPCNILDANSGEGVVRAICCIASFCRARHRPKLKVWQLGPR